METICPQNTTIHSQPFPVLSRLAVPALRLSGIPHTLRCLISVFSYTSVIKVQPFEAKATVLRGAKSLHLACLVSRVSVQYFGSETGVAVIA